jgi:hypothetical protein
MAGFVEGTDREQMTLLPARLDDYYDNIAVTTDRLSRLYYCM